ncbi:hypothetical protein WMY93_009533 [Mugilogobius chulae]|uniref:Ribonuclease A-domain domain-containing protein n=1 Tax=Mugilogobius chulae TaxID=88201 RepID=A0AAW0PBV8_9GOBI
MLKTKNINSENQKCKKTNTFMEATVQDVIDVCKNGERIQVQNESMQKSRKLFRLTVCSVSQPGQFPHCKYKGEIKEAKVVIRCTDVNLPVHFHDEADYHDSGQRAMRTCLVFLLLLAPSLLLGQTNRDFITKHVQSNMNPNRCDNEMRRRRITGPDGKCKDKDTFITAGTKEINKVCGKAGSPYKNTLLRESNKPLSTVVCTLKGGRYPNCEYRGRTATLYIVVACRGGLPVHYESGNPYRSG